jgi:NitT/TauT family transport system permease protein
MSADTEEAAALTGLDNLENGPVAPSGRSAAEIGGIVWGALWPKLLAVAIVLALWELVYLLNFKPHDILPGPGQVFPDLWSQLTHGQLWKAIGITLRRAVVGFALALVIGTLVGLVVARVPPVRVAIGSLITGLQTIPSVVWIPFAIILFGNNTTAILFMVIITAAPSIANGLIAGVDFTPPLLMRAGRTMGLRRFALYRDLIMPAALPPFVAGLKQGWAFAWRSLMAGELIVLVLNQPSLGELLNNDQSLADLDGATAIMIVILIIGLVVDGLFGAADKTIRKRWGLA